MKKKKLLFVLLTAALIAFAVYVYAMPLGLTMSRLTRYKESIITAGRLPNYYLAMVISLIYLASYFPTIMVFMGFELLQKKVSTKILVSLIINGIVSIIIATLTVEKMHWILSLVLEIVSVLYFLVLTMKWVLIKRAMIEEDAIRKVLDRKQL